MTTRAKNQVSKLSFSIPIIMIDVIDQDAWLWRRDSVNALLHGRRTGGRQRTKAMFATLAGMLAALGECFGAPSTFFRAATESYRTRKPREEIVHNDTGQ